MIWKQEKSSYTKGGLRMREPVCFNNGLARVSPIKKMRFQGRLTRG